MRRRGLSRRGVVVGTLALGATAAVPARASTVSAAPRGAGLTAREQVAEAAAALRVWDADDVRGNLTLSTEGLHGTRISWTSSDERTVTATGEVDRPAHGSAPARVTLTATVRSGDARAQRRFGLTVRPLPRTEPYEGYLFTYFAGEDKARGEQIYFAATKGNDPRHWDELNDGRPVLASTQGERGVRDPFLIRSPEGDRFFLLASDLRIYGNGDWDAAKRHGSKHLEVWESADLVHWSEQRHVRVSADTAGMTWAPEAHYDDALGAYVVYWASRLYDKDDPDHTGDSYEQMMYATTRDFRTFSEPRVWNDPGHPVLDSTVIRHGDTYYRFTKDARSADWSHPCGKFITQEKSTDLRDTDWKLVAECVGKGDATNPGVSEGEGPAVFKSNTEEKWYLLIDEYTGRGYVPFETTDLASGRWTPSEGFALPSSPRHGTVVPVTRAELERVRVRVRRR